MAAAYPKRPRRRPVRGAMVRPGPGKQRSPEPPHYPSIEETRMELGLAGKTVIVTGGSGGIGRGLVLEFAREGCNVVSASRDEATGRKLA
ncbi:MAG: SDR family NAD(P)-dependent oxidoreductase, partial [Gammaproteobacteria bacterium]